jgi:hypothetical protein
LELVLIVKIKGATPQTINGFVVVVLVSTFEIYFYDNKSGILISKKRDLLRIAWRLRESEFKEKGIRGTGGKEGGEFARIKIKSG